jgi:hypothetical protein
MRSVQNSIRTWIASREFYCPVAIRHVVEARDPIEDAAWFDPAFEDIRQKLVDVRAGRSRTAAHGDVVEEGRQRCWNRLFLGKTDATDCATRTGDAAPLSDRSFAPGVLGIEPPVQRSVMRRYRSHGDRRT